MNPRDFHQDFLLPAIGPLSEKDAVRVAIALDAAIMFGALEYAEGNKSLQDKQSVEHKYTENVARLKS